MKKYLILPIFLFTLFVSVNKVSADDDLNIANIDNYYSQFSQQINIINNYQSQIHTLTNYWSTNLRSISSNYIIRYFENSSPSCSNNLCQSIYLYPLTSNYIYSLGDISNSYFGYDYIYRGESGPIVLEYIISSVSSSLNGSFRFLVDDSDVSSSVQFTQFPPLYSYKQLNYYNENGRILHIPSYNDNDYNFSAYNLSSGDFFPTLNELLNDSYNPLPNDNYITINLKNYSYVILSLKNYNQTAFSTNIYTLGSLCLTPVYDYGMKQKNEYINGYKTPSCTSYYDSLTPVPLYIIEPDLQYNAVYYISSQLNELPNTISVDSSIFNISYITSENADNPSVSINGRNYPVIPYNDLTDTAIISTNEGYISGQVCAIGDVNCEYNTGIGLDISDLWTEPLKVLQSVWSSITSVFILIGQFIALIPSPLKEFLISAFMLAIILGVLKIIL